MVRVDILYKLSTNSCTYVNDLHCLILPTKKKDLHRFIVCGFLFSLDLVPCFQLWIAFLVFLYSSNLGIVYMGHQIPICLLQILQLWRFCSARRTMVFMEFGVMVVCFLKIWLVPIQCWKNRTRSNHSIG